MILGIQIKPGKGQGEPTVFYCGRDGVAFRKAHAELVADNKDGSRFFSVVNPLLVPLQNIVHSTEDHPDIVAAQKRRAQLAALESSAETSAGESGPKVPVTSQARQDALMAMKKPDLLAITDSLKGSGKQLNLGNGTKPELVAAILQAEGFEPIVSGPPAE